MRYNGTLTTCFTIGHSNHSLERFIELLRMYKINCLIDVRSAPYSKYTPQYNKEQLEAGLIDNKIAYVYMGNKLGGRYTNPQLLFPDGMVNFAKVRETEVFQDGAKDVISKIESGMIVAIMCSEKDPFNCHRFALVSRGLSIKGVKVKHIYDNGAIVDNETLEEKLLNTYKKNYQEKSLFEPAQTKEQALEEAYEMRNKDVAYSVKEEKGY